MPAIVRVSVVSVAVPGALIDQWGRSRFLIQPELCTLPTAGVESLNKCRDEAGERWWCFRGESIQGSNDV